MPRKYQEVGNRYGKLTVLKEYGNDKRGRTRWLCRCDCGKEKIALGIYLRDGTTNHCGCLRTTRIKAKKAKTIRGFDETGNRYGKLLVLERYGRNKRGQATWLCQCDCGNKKILVGCNLRQGRVISCGCHKNKTSTIDETGNRYGKLLVLERRENAKRKYAAWLCQCDCGNKIIVAGILLRKKTIKSCGKCEQ